MTDRQRARRPALLLLYAGALLLLPAWSILTPVTPVRGSVAWPSIGPEGVAPTQQAPPRLLWPADVDPAMTSAFGEYRPGHIHAGLDIKTWGRIGVPMLAAADGFLRRIRVSPWGYGKSLYLEMTDGRTAVYAHLDHFTDRVEARVREKQEADRRYTVDIWLRPGEIPVKRGEIIAFSGQTGTSAPHLHFELRDKNNAPMNPLENGLRVKDTTPPVIQGLIVRPVGEGATLEGDARVRRYGVQARGDRYTLRGRPEFDGGVAFSVPAYDRMDGTWNNFGPYRLTLEVDGMQRFEIRYDRFSYDRSDLIDLDRDYRYLVREGVKAHTLFRQRGNALPFYGPYQEGDGYITDLAPGIHRIVIRVADAAGNESLLEGELLRNRSPVVTSARTTRLPVAGGPVIALDISAEDPDGDSVGLEVETFEPSDTTDSGETWQSLAIEPWEGEGPGPLTLPDTPTGSDGYYVRVRARDSWGRVGPPVIVPVGSPSVRDPGAITLETERYEDTLLLRATTEHGVPGRMEFSIGHEGGRETIVEGIPGSSGAYTGAWRITPAQTPGTTITARFIQIEGEPATARQRLDIVTVRAEGAGRFRSADDHLTIAFPARSLFDDGFIQETGVRRAEHTVAQSLVPLSDVHDMGPMDIPFRRSAALTLRTRSLPAGVRASQVGLFTEGTDPEKPWVWLGGSWQDRLLTADVGGLGPFAAMADTVRPEVRLLSLKDGAEVRTGTPRLEFSVTDNASGFTDDRQFVLRIDGTQVIAEYDPIRNRIRYEPYVPLEPGDHWVRLDATDAAGNLRTVTARIRVR